MDFSCGRSRHLPARGERNQAGVVHKPTWSTTKVAQLRYSGPSLDWIGTTFAGSCFNLSCGRVKVHRVTIFAHLDDPARIFNHDRRRLASV